MPKLREFSVTFNQRQWGYILLLVQKYGDRPKWNERIAGAIGTASLLSEHSVQERVNTNPKVVEA